MIIFGGVETNESKHQFDSVADLLQALSVEWINNHKLENMTNYDIYQIWNFDWHGAIILYWSVNNCKQIKSFSPVRPTKQT